MSNMLLLHTAGGRARTSNSPGPSHNLGSGSPTHKLLEDFAHIALGSNYQSLDYLVSKELFNRFFHSRPPIHP